MAPLCCTAKFDPFLFLGLCRVGGRDQILPSGHTGGEDGGDHRFHQKLVRSRSLIFTHAATTDADADGQTRVRPDCRRHDIVSSTRFDAAELQVGREQIGEGRRTMGPWEGLEVSIIFGIIL